MNLRWTVYVAPKLPQMGSKTQGVQHLTIICDNFETVRDRPIRKWTFESVLLFCIEPACGGVYAALSGNITSPYYPDMYPNNKECEYVIRQPEGSIITLTFLRFNLEGSFEESRCYHDYLEVGRGINVSIPQLHYIRLKIFSAAKQSRQWVSGSWVMGQMGRQVWIGQVDHGSVP